MRAANTVAFFSYTFHGRGCAVLALNRRSMLLVVALCTTNPAQAASVERGKALYENHCLGCHEDTVHVRKKHKAANFADIVKFVARWETELKLGWSTEDRADVANYINGQFYNY